MSPQISQIGNEPKRRSWELSFAPRTEAALAGDAAMFRCWRVSRLLGEIAGWFDGQPVESTEGSKGSKDQA